ncbi:hypothetical protein DRW41_09040 [Neobacillus piezotolerans]|uniref:Uncharacterized protein n=1 Tax=Neobacillus piezotolerans TaxID=2259171 RepID=A0A3D8GQR8_9BACI|nr:hypothetical protein [Neobacillus piezotolerans]RDU36845.1 hypothetical protein DRW41_09040 [Neobacillus piezotolerans]
MYELKLRSIIRLVKSDNPQKRFEGLDQLYEYRQVENLEVQVDVLRDMIIAAAGNFPEPVDKWDNPSYYLTDFVCNFSIEEVVVCLVKNFDGLSIAAKERAIEYLLGTENEEIFHFLEEKIVGLINGTETFTIPIGELTTYPVLARDILDKTLDRLRSEHYKFMMYDLLLCVNSSEVDKGYKKQAVLPILLEDYQAAKVLYLNFDKDYSSKFVYTAWKENYFYIRSRMRLFLTLMKYYFSEESEKELLEALSFNDPFIKTEALLVCLAKNLPFDQTIIADCAENIESAEMAYWELREMDLEHLYPIKEGKQPHLAKTRLFSTIVNFPEDEDGATHFPENIRIIDKVETENYYGQPIRFYMMGFKELDREFIGWAGAFALEDGDDTAHLWDGTYTEFEELDSMSIEGHKEAFFKRREEVKSEVENSVFYESKPRLSKGMWFFYGLLIMHWIRNAMRGFEGPLLPSLLFTLAGVALTINELKKNKTKSISIVGHELILQDGKKREGILLHEIERVEYTKRHVLVYGQESKPAMKFPLAWVRYEVFSHHMRELTGHLRQGPYIQP